MILRLQRLRLSSAMLAALLQQRTTSTSSAIPITKSRRGFLQYQHHHHRQLFRSSTQAAFIFHGARQQGTAGGGNFLHLTAVPVLPTTHYSSRSYSSHHELRTKLSEEDSINSEEATSAEGHHRCHHNAGSFLHLVNTVAEATKKTIIEWDDRLELQRRWSNHDKGWQVDVEWKMTPFSGVGLFARQFIPKDTIVRVGRIDINLLQFESVKDIEEKFLFRRGVQQTVGSGNVNIDDEDYQKRLRYVKDYLWGFCPYDVDDRGYFKKVVVDNKAEVAMMEEKMKEHEGSKSSESSANDDEDDRRFFGMWIPGNGLNHSPNPNTVYRPVFEDDDDRRQNLIGIDLIALDDIGAGEEMTDDYRRHGLAPKWIVEDFLLPSSNKDGGDVDRSGTGGTGDAIKMSLNFADCNDFVVDDDSGCCEDDNKR